MVSTRRTARTCWRATVVVGAALLLAGCGAATPGTVGQPSATTSSSASSPSRLLDPAAFAQEVAGGARVVNVHTPDEGSIAGTDAAIPFDQLSARADELPKDTSAPLAVYCRSGSMSANASVTLAAMGYTDVVELRGGMKAWSAAGRELLP